MTQIGIICTPILQEEKFFQRYPDPGDQLRGAWIVHKKAQKFDWKTQSKLACDYMWLFHGKICLSDDPFS